METKDSEDLKSQGAWFSVTLLTLLLFFLPLFRLCHLSSLTCIFQLGATMTLIGLGGGTITSETGVGAIAGIEFAFAGVAVSVSSISHIGQDIANIAKYEDSNKGGGNGASNKSDGAGRELEKKVENTSEKPTCQENKSSPKQDTRKASEIIQTARKGSINREFPDQYRDKTMQEIEKAAKSDKDAKKALRLLKDGRFKK